MSEIKFVVVPQEFDEDGKFSMSQWIPLGYHHILKVHKDGSYYIAATLFARPDDDKGMEVAKVVAKGLPVEVDPEFYNKR